MMGEFGRTPKINPNAGRDHHGRANSVLLFGAGIPGGLVLGRTDAQGDAPVERPVTPERPGVGSLSQAGRRPRDPERRAGRPADPHRRRVQSAPGVAVTRISDRGFSKSRSSPLVRIPNVRPPCRVAQAAEGVRAAMDLATRRVVGVP